MLPLRRAPNTTSRALSYLARTSHRPHYRPAHLFPTLSTTIPRFSSTTTPPPPSAIDASSSSSPAAKPQPLQDDTPSNPSSSSPQDPPQQPPPPHRRRLNLSLRPLILATTFLAAGLLTGNLIRFTIAPPPLPDAGTDMDNALQAKLREELDALPIIQDLTCASGAQEWGEVPPWSGFGAGESVMLPDERHMVSQTLAALKGFGPARRFVRRDGSGESVTVFWVGGGLTGWPGVAHGGALATAFLEAFGASPNEERKLAEPADLSLTYLAPTIASNFFVLRAKPELSPWPKTELEPMKDMTKRPVPSADRPAGGGEEWSGTLMAVQGRVCVKAKAVLAR